MSRLKDTWYFEDPGKGNTGEALRLAKARAEELGIKSIVVASSSGETGAEASRIFKGYNLVVVTSVTGYSRPDEVRMRPEHRMAIEANGGRVVTAAHAFGTVGRAVHNKFGAVQVDEVVAHVLRLFSEGFKVACEVSCMAVDAGYLRTDEEAIAVGGSGGGSDTAIVVKPSNTHALFDLRVREIICKPR